MRAQGWSRLDGQVAAVTGGASGIGKAVVDSLARLGAMVVVVDINPPDHTDAAHIMVDLADPVRCEAVVAEILERAGRLDILVNAAGMTGGGRDVAATDVETWDLVYAVNVRAPFVLSKAMAAHVAERGGGGRIVNVSSSSAFRAFYAPPAYASSKAAINGLTRSLAGQLAPLDINVNSVAPGLTATPMTMASRTSTDELDANVRSGPVANVFGRVSLPEDVAAAVVFLCLPESRQITGQVIHTSAGAVV